MRKTTSMICVASTVFLITLALFSTVVAEEVRHPKNIGDLVDAGFRSYRELTEWLRYTGIASKLNINLSDVKDVVLKSQAVLDEVYNNASLSMFIGAIQLKQLKMFSQLTNYIGHRDIVNLLKMVTLGLNISRVDFRCRDLFSKLLINIVQPGFCNYTLTDLDHLTWYIMKLSSVIPVDRLTSILGKVYTMKMAMRVKAISRDMLNRLLDDLLYRESIVVYLILNDVVVTNRIVVVTSSQETSGATTTKGLVTYNKSSDKVLTFEDLEKALSIVTEILRLSEKYSISLTSEDILNIVNYILSLDIEEAVALLKSIDESHLRYLGQSQAHNSRNSAATIPSEVNEEEENASYIMPMVPPDEFHDYYREFEEYLRESTETSDVDRGGLGGNVGEGPKTIDVDAYIVQVIASGLLSTVLEKVNTPIIFIPSLSSIDSSWNTPTYPRRSTKEMQIGRGPSSYSLWLYVILLLSTSVGVALVFKPHIVLRVLMRMSKLFRSSVEGVYKARSNSVFELFWVLMYKLAKVLGIQIAGSDTHREAYAKIVSKVIDGDLKQKLKDITKDYEVLRFSDKHYLDKDLWVKSVVSILSEYD
ncbi:MAG: hypothetical protein QXZ41_06085 [Ignisphaera sp.]